MTEGAESTGQDFNTEARRHGSKNSIPTVTFSSVHGDPQVSGRASCDLILYPGVIGRLVTRAIISLAVASSVAITAPSAGLGRGQMPSRMSEALQKIDVRDG